MPRTMTSTASGSAFRNAFSRRFFRKPSTQRGRPRPAAKADAGGAEQAAADHEGDRRSTTAPKMPDMIQNFCGVQVQPGLARGGCCSGTDFSFLRARVEFLQRALDLLAARALGLLGLTRRDRFGAWRSRRGGDSAFLSPDSNG